MAVQLVRLNQDAQVGLAHPSKLVNQLSLSAGAAATFTVPAGARSVEIFYTAGVLYCRADGSAAVVPAATITDGTGSAGINQGAAFAVDQGEIFSLINADACVVTLAYRSAS